MILELGTAATDSDLHSSAGHTTKFFSVLSQQNLLAGSLSLSFVPQWVLGQQELSVGQPVCLSSVQNPARLSSLELAWQELG